MVRIINLISNKILLVVIFSFLLISILRLLFINKRLLRENTGFGLR